MEHDQSIERPRFENIRENEYAYFVHSYYAELNGILLPVPNMVPTSALPFLKIIFMVFNFIPENQQELANRS